MFCSYLSNRQQQCSVNGITSELLHIACGVPQGTILGPLLFLIYINDLPNCLRYSTARLYADDTTLTFPGSDIVNIKSALNVDLELVSLWLKANKLSLNVLKTECMVIGSRQRLSTFDFEEDFKISVNGFTLERVEHSKCLGVHIDQNLTWAKHVESIILKVTRNIRILRTVCSSLSIDNRITVYRSIIEPYFNYCSIVWDSLTDTLSGKLQRLQNRAARIISGLPYSVRSNEIRTRLGWSSLDEIRKQQKAIMMYKIVHGHAPRYLQEMFTRQLGSRVYGLRNSYLNLEIPQTRTSHLRNSFLFTGAQIWNSLPESLKTQKTINSFKKHIKKYKFASTTQS